MGDVWLAAQHNAEVALKVITSHRARDPRSRVTFQNEMRSMAGLCHPGIIMVLDVGVVTPQAAIDSDDELVADSPYFAMELGRETLLDEKDKITSFDALRSVLLQLLDALAHAHARGVIHRDIKPANVLRAIDSRAFKLADFSVAHVLRAPGADKKQATTSGTPRYMAPEQVVGEIRDQGPWTDLYALGCVAFWLSTGEAPYHGNVNQVLRAHIEADVPAMKPRFEVPAGFEPLVRRMLAKATADRYQRAADAAHDLLALSMPIPADQAVTRNRSREQMEAAVIAHLSADEQGFDAISAPTEKRPAKTPRDVEDEAFHAIAAPTVARRAADIEDEAFHAIAAPTEKRHAKRSDNATRQAAIEDHESVAVRAIAVPSVAISSKERDDISTWPDEVTVVFDRKTWPGREMDVAGPPEAAPVALNWRADDAVLPPQLLGAGLGLYHLRPIPLVDRDKERDALWTALLEAAGAERPRLAIVRGAAGVGKSRVVEWMAQRAHELGAATILKASHAPIGGANDGIGPMLAQHVRAGGLTRIDVMERLRRVISMEGRRPFNLTDVELLADLLGASAEHQGARPADRHRAVAKLIEAVARERAVMLWIDDAQWGAEALELAAYLLDESEAPLLIALTVRDESVGDRPIASRLLQQMLLRDKTRVIELRPLSRQDHEALVARLLSLQGELALSVAERTEGNPLFAVQLVGDWVERGVLEVGDGGFRLRFGERAPIPDSIHELWMIRLARLSQAGDGSATTLALELAATLGQEIDEDEWSACCAAENIALPDDLVERLLTARLALPGRRHSWSFAHAMLRESIDRLAHEAGRSSRHHRTCAAVLRRRGASPRRVAEHLLRAGDWLAALGPLLEAAENAARRGEFERALTLDDQRDAALDAAGVRPDDKQRVVGWLRRARTQCLRGDVASARELVRRAETMAAPGHPLHDDTEVCAALAWVLTILARFDNEFEKGVASATEAIEHFESLQDELGAARVRKKLGELLRLLGKGPASVEHYITAQATFERIGDHFELAWTSMGLSATFRQQGNVDEAEAHAARGLAAFKRIGSRLGVGHAHNELGEAARARGRYQDAERHYERVLDEWQQERHRDLELVRYNIGLARMGRGALEQARTIIGAVLQGAEKAERRALIIYSLSGLTQCCASLGDFDAAEQYAARLLPLLRQISLIDLDIAEALTAAGHAAEIGAPELARTAFDLALIQWQSLGDSDQIVEIRAKLAALRNLSP